MPLSLSLIVLLVLVPAQALTAPGRFGQFEEIDDILITADAVVNVIASCQNLVVLHLDDILSHDPAQPELDAPHLAASHAFTFAQLKAIETGCTKLEEFVVRDDPDRPACEAGQPSRLIDLVDDNVDELPRLAQVASAWTPDQGHDPWSDGTMLPFNWADHEEWVVSRETTETAGSPSLERLCQQ